MMNKNCLKISDLLDFATLTLVFRECSPSSNRVAHGLTEFAQFFSFHVSMFWLDDVHVNVFLIVVSDILE